MCVSALGLKESPNCCVCHISCGVGGKTRGAGGGGHLSLHCVCGEGGGDVVEGGPGPLLC